MTNDDTLLRVRGDFYICLFDQLQKQYRTQSCNYHLWTSHRWTVELKSKSWKQGMAVVKGKERVAVKAALKQSGSLLQYKSTMRGVIAHRLKRLLSHAAQQQVHFDRWGSKQSYITHNYLGDINQILYAAREETKGDNQHFEVSTWRLRHMQGTCAVSYWESVWSRAHVKPLIMTTPPPNAGATKMLVKMKNTQACVQLCRSYVNHVLHWHAHCSRTPERKDKNALQIGKRVCQVSQANFLSALTTGSSLTHTRATGDRKPRCGRAFVSAALQMCFVKR